MLKELVKAKKVLYGEFHTEVYTRRIKAIQNMAPCICLHEKCRGLFLVSLYYLIGCRHLSGVTLVSLLHASLKWYY